MTYGHGQPHGGWLPPSEPASGPPAERRPPDGDAPPSPVARPTPGYGPAGRTFEAPSPDHATLTTRFVARHPVPRPTSGPPGGVPPLPSQWGPVPEPPQPTLPAPTPRSRERRRAARTETNQPPGWLTAIGVLAVVVLAAVCAAGGYLVFAHPGTPSSVVSAAPARPTPRDISNRQVDPAPLTEAELFPKPTVPGGYQVIKTQAGDCAAAAVGDTSKLLATAGCTQMVRASLVSQDQVYVVTAGLLNLASQDNAKLVNDGLATTVGPQKGRFTGFPAGGASDVFTRSPTQLGWDLRGHFLGYCVVARVDGQPLAATDPQVRRVIDDIVEKYLIGTVVQARAKPVPPSAAARPSHK